MKIGIAGAEQDFRARLDRILAPGTTLVPCTVDDLTTGAAQHLQAIVIGSEIPVQEALRAAQALDSSQPDTGVVLIAEPHPKMLRAALLAGARDVWSPDINDHELETSLHRVLAVAARRSQPLHRAAGPPERPTTQVIVVLSPKGGAGKTTVATNLAIGVAGATEVPVALVDLDLQFGDVATALSLDPDKTMADTAKLAGNPTAIKTTLTPHPSGVHALCAPVDPVQADLISPEISVQILRSLASEFATVVIDTSAGLDEHTLGALDLATDLVIVSTTDIFAINGTRKLLDVLEEIDLGEPDRHLVLNRANARVDIDRAEIERTLNWAVDIEIPSTRAVPLAMNRGESIYESGRVARKPMLELLGRFVEPANQKAGRWSNR